MKNLMTKEDLDQVIIAVNTANSANLSNSKADLIMLSEFAKVNNKTQVELMNNETGDSYTGSLEYAALDITNLAKADQSSLLYVIRLSGFEDPFVIKSNNIQYNSYNPRKFYFRIDKEITWRIIFR